MSEATPTEIKQRLDTEVKRIRSDRDLSTEAKRRLIGEAYGTAEQEYQQAVETQEQEIQERVGTTEREVFRARYPAGATEAGKASIRTARRQAYSEVYNSVARGGADDPLEELERLLQRAERSGDPELAEAVYHVATELGYRSVADSYLETRPAEKHRWEEYVKARTEADSIERQLGRSVGLMGPLELSER